MKETKWRKIYDTEIGGNKLVVYSDWISYKNIGFNPKIHIKEVLEEHKNNLKAIKIAYKKWLEEYTK